MPQFVTGKDENVQNMNDISSDFACLKVSALGKVSRISTEIDQITIGPDSKVNKNDYNKSENIENEQNSCNVKHPQQTNDAQGEKISTPNGITFSVKKILLESELQRREEVRKEIERHWQHMRENGRAIQEHMAWSRSYMARERERKSAEKLAYILAEEERIAEQEELRRRHELQLHAQRAREQKEKLEREMEDYRKKMREREELNKRVMSLRNDFGVKYCDIVMLSKGCKDKDSVAIVLSSYATRLKELFQQMELIDRKIRSGELGHTDINALEAMNRQIDEILSMFRSDIENVDAVYEANMARLAQCASEAQGQTEIVKQQHAAAEQKIPEVQVPEQSNNVVVAKQEYQAAEPQNVTEPAKIMISTIVPPTIATVDVGLEATATSAEQNEGNLYEYVDKESLQLFINSQQFLENYLKNYAEVLQSAATKKFRFECQKAINIPVNAISGISESHLRDKYERLHNLLIGKSTPNVSQHPQGAAFCKTVLANKIVSQGETLVSSKPKMAFPIAAVIVALWNDHVDFGELLLAHFHNACPITVPVFMPKTEGQSNEDYYKCMGYKYADGTAEKHDMFLKRMSGLMRLYASITITAQRKGINKTHPHGLQHAWRWLAAILNIEPRADVTDLCATLLLDMLEVAGCSLWVAYPKQFYKLLLLISGQYYPRMQSVGCIASGPLVRLEEFLKNSLTRGSILPPDGALPPNFW